MAALIGIANTTGEVPLSAATAKTILQVQSPSNHRLKILGWGVYFDGTSSSAEPIQVRLLEQQNTGTMFPLTINKQDPSLRETIQSTASINATAEPAVGLTIFKRIEVHPQGGYEELRPFSQEYIVSGNGKVGIECTAPATVNVHGYINFEE